MATIDFEGGPWQHANEIQGIRAIEEATDRPLNDVLHDQLILTCNDCPQQLCGAYVVGKCSVRTHGEDDQLTGRTTAYPVPVMTIELGCRQERCPSAPLIENLSERLGFLAGTCLHAVEEADQKEAQASMPVSLGTRNGLRREVFDHALAAIDMLGKSPFPTMHPKQARLLL